MSEPVLFAQCLTQIMRKHRLSLGDLSGMIGTRADLRHILADDATHTIRSRVLEKLKSLQLFDDGDYAALEHSLHISRLGLENYRFQQAVTCILTGEHHQSAQEIIVDEHSTLAQRLALFDALDNIEIICFNACFPAVFSALKPLFRNPERSIFMRHYVQSDSHWNTAAEYVAAAFPLLFDSRYTAFVRNPAMLSKVPVLGGNLLLLRARQYGLPVESAFVITDSRTALELPNASACELYAFVNKVLQKVQPPPMPIKEENPHDLDFPSLCMTFLSHELNRATYCIFNDLCFEQVPTDIAIAAFKDKNYASAEETMRIISRTLSIHEQRYQNQYRKTKPTYRIMTIEGCKNFLASGMTTDHFIGFRAFTLQERKIIFRNMLQAAQNNRFFIPMLLKDERFTHRYNLVCYDNLGVSIDAKDTDYDISNGYRSVFLQFPDFTQQYREYYLKILVGEMCYSRQESLALLTEMYQAFIAEFSLTDDETPT